MNDRVIVIMNFKTPDAINRKKNSSHISYIAKRQGAATELDQSLDNVLLNETDEQLKTEKNSKHGLFGPNGAENLKEIKKEILQHNGIVWRMRISLREEDARRLNMTTRRDWELMIKDQIPIIQKAMNLQGVRWVAAYHPEQGHPHLHLVLWEKNPLRKRGVYPNKTMERIQNSLIKYIYKPDRIRQLQERDALKSYLIQKNIHDVDKIKEILKEIKSDERRNKNELKAMGLFANQLPRKPLDSEIEKIRQLLEKTLPLLPRSGRVSYHFLNANNKKEMDRIVDELFQMKDYEYLVKKHSELLEHISSLSGHSDEHKKDFITKKENEIRNKIADIFLRAALVVKKYDGKTIQAGNSYQPDSNSSKESSWKLTSESNKRIGKNIEVNVLSSIFRSTMTNLEREYEIAKAQGERLRLKNKQKTKHKGKSHYHRYENER